MWMQYPLVSSQNTSHIKVIVKDVYICRKFIYNFVAKFISFFPLYFLCMENLKFKSYTGKAVEQQTSPSSQSVFHSFIPWGVPISCVFHFKFCFLECYFLSFGFHKGQRNLQQIKNVNIQSSTGNLPIQCLKNIQL